MEWLPSSGELGGAGCAGAAKPSCAAGAWSEEARLESDRRERSMEWLPSSGELGGAGCAAICSESTLKPSCAAGVWSEEARLESDRRERSCRLLPAPSSSAVLAAVISGNPGSRSRGLQAVSCERGTRGASDPSALSAQTGDWLRAVRSELPCSFSLWASTSSPRVPSTAALVRSFSSRTAFITSLISVSCLEASCCIAATYFTIVSRWHVVCV
mmetsp:Transcript_103536/g.251413  ORF Transcript_103536/g.251413 Transcript_103536/m.251413 type:complete len:214 (-) Transcript_103536:1057-1698(-)